MAYPLPIVFKHLNLEWTHSKFILGIQLKPFGWMSNNKLFERGQGGDKTKSKAFGLLKKEGGGGGVQIRKGTMRTSLDQGGP